jgi:hypothetical protein
MNTDHIYWTFSSAAQCISAFVAFLLTGYALVHSLMESARERDDTLEEIHAELRKTYHRRLSWLAWLTGAAIVLSLIVVYENRLDAAVANWALATVGAIDLAAVIAGLAFVVKIVDPEKYRRAAAKVLEKATIPIAIATPSSEFFDGFLHLERLLRDYLKKMDIYVPSRGAPRMSFSFRQMVEALRVNERIDAEFYRELLELNKYRNLVFHGHVTQVDAAMVRRTRDAAARMEELTSKPLM